MKIWIDLTNSPHINFFKPFIDKWKLEGNELIITTRDLANTLDLIRQNNWKYSQVGGHVGKNKFKKIIYFPFRVLSLIRFLKKNKPDIGISHSSFYSPVVCKFLKIPSIYLNDNEYAKGNYIALKFASIVYLPEFLKDFATRMRWSEKYNIEYYPGIKEGIYLSKSNITVFNNKKTVKIFIRLEPWTAEYYNGNSNFMDDVITGLSKKYNVTILPRSKKQYKYFKQDKFKYVKVAKKAIAFDYILKNCSLFIGAGGSMTRELALCGVSTISVYQAELLSVDNHLIKNGFMKHIYSPKIEDIEEIINKSNLSNNSILIEKGRVAFHMIDNKLKKIVDNYNY